MALDGHLQRDQTRFQTRLGRQRSKEEETTVVTPPQSYAARLEIDYPEKLDRFTTFFRLIWIDRKSVV